MDILSDCMETHYNISYEISLRRLLLALKPDKMSWTRFEVQHLWKGAYIKTLNYNVWIQKSRTFRSRSVYRDRIVPYCGNTAGDLSFKGGYQYHAEILDFIVSSEKRRPEGVFSSTIVRLLPK
ncbi:hypothetical protein NPIL_222301 [Nephila pilipes]|uniref:Uncharacterized protein n=1 Tax=Nephila pilipes TaxID=299642 RepID=A0A8X6PAX0_NEPPI|nr:hypothetical protein NPIL_222301 [Nephila pilipes]